MPRRTYLAETPGVARHIAEYLGIKERRGGVYVLKNGDYVTNNIGQLRDPDKRTADHLRTVVKLLKEADIIVNASGLDREGRLRADEVIAYAGFDPAGSGKLVERVAITATNKASLRVALASPVRRRSKGDETYVDHAHRREVFDVEIDVGCVEALGLVLMRELEIRSFKPVTYYVPRIILPDGVVLTWTGRIEGADDQGIDAEGRIIDRRVAEAILARIRQGLVGKCTDFQEITREQAPPLPYSLAKLQTEMSARHSMSAKETSRAVQDLYETRGMVSYGWTDCQYLPKSMHAEAPGVLKGISGMYTRYANGTNPKIEYACWDDSKAAIPHAIIPTGKLATGLTEGEQRVFDAVARRYIAQFYPKHKFLQFNLEGQYGDDMFGSTWKKTLVDGWKVADQPAGGDEQHTEGIEE
ncbi:DNA topoisomerase 3 [Paraburkholderia ultramafica]|uniref:DNA topoisomerase 3 n=1 Tax=Paraburkholderia ultramafica TaxID=1544867 RepID=A0A6S7DFW6_9BURK|nr:DNA topoisomerase [Paraburkholderia ultramafica]CAB3804369.1 DNA topoisomerase 3 [Paraburkholderia ultramafica]